MNAKPLRWSQLAVRLVAAALLFAVANAIVYSVSPFFAQAREYSRQVEGLFERPNAHVLILGDSHVAQLHDSFLADTAYNAAFGGDSLRECYAKLVYLSQRRPEIDMVILSADLHMFGSGRLESANRVFADRYFLLTGSSVGIEQGPLSALRQQIPLFNDDFVQFLRRTTVARLKARASNVDTGTASSRTWAELSEEERAARALSTGESDHQGIMTHREPIEWYERIVELAQQRGIRVVAVRYPAHPLYFAEVTDEQVATLDNELARMGVTDIFDFRRSLANPQDFNDPDHVSASGARKLLELLQERLNLELLADADTPRPVDASD